MTGFVILCILAVVSGFVLLGFAEEYEGNSFWRQDFKSFVASMFAVAAFVMMWFIVLIDYNTIAMKIIAMVISLWLLLTMVINAGIVSIAYVFIGLCAIGLYCENPYGVYEADKGLELRHPLTYWMTGRVEAAGDECVEYCIGARRGVDRKKDGMDIQWKVVRGLSDSAGRLHLPGICRYEDGFTECYIEFYKADLNNVEVFHLCRDDGTSARLDFLGKNTETDGYRQPVYNNDVEVNTNY